MLPAAANVQHASTLFDTTRLAITLNLPWFQMDVNMPRLSSLVPSYANVLSVVLLSFINPCLLLGLGSDCYLEFRLDNVLENCNRSAACFGARRVDSWSRALTFTHAIFYSGGSLHAIPIYFQNLAL